MKIEGVKEVIADPKTENVWVTFDARKTHAPELHDAILRSGYKPAPTARVIFCSGGSTTAEGSFSEDRAGAHRSSLQCRLLLSQAVKCAQAPDYFPAIDRDDASGREGALQNRRRSLIFRVGKGRRSKML